jgi:hypothetical protein
MNQQKNVQSSPQSESGFFRFVDFMREARTRAVYLGILIAIVSFFSAIMFERLPRSGGLFGLGIGFVMVVMMLWAQSRPTLGRETYLEGLAGGSALGVICLGSVSAMISGFRQAWGWVLWLAVMTLILAWLRLQAKKALSEA